jgi:hypothetical protein
MGTAEKNGAGGISNVCVGARMCVCACVCVCVCACVYMGRDESLEDPSVSVRMALTTRAADIHATWRQEPSLWWELFHRRC